MTTPETSRLQRRLQRTLLIGAVAVCVIIALGIGLRLRAQAQVERWTENQAIPTVDTLSPQPTAKMLNWCCPERSAPSLMHRSMPASMGT